MLLENRVNNVRYRMTAQGLSDSDRFRLQTALHNAGLSQNGAMQFANGHVVTDPRDRATFAALVAGILRQDVASSNLLRM
jgi:hypothetical protein